MHSDEITTAADGIEVFRQRWTVEAPKGTVVIAHGAAEAPLQGLLHQGVRGITRVAIWLSTRI